jgi:hypothetical protein
MPALWKHERQAGGKEEFVGQANRVKDANERDAIGCKKISKGLLSFPSPPSRGRGLG